MSEILPLPIVEDTVPAKVSEDIEQEVGKAKEEAKIGKNEVTSFSFDQVNSNADELIELRGEGRYFGVTDPSSSNKTINALQALGPLCANCHKRGHIRAKCKTVVCHKCGIVGDHYESQCPTTMICSRCNIKGHMASDCKAKERKKQYCKNCDTFSHLDHNCPKIWRSYLTKKAETNKLPVIFCYNCGDSSHYGDECSLERTSRIPNFGLAFSGNNLPLDLRSLYFTNKNTLTKPTPKINSKYSGGYSNGYNDSRIYDNTDYYEKFLNHNQNQGYVQSNNNHNNSRNYSSGQNKGNYNDNDNYNRGQNYNNQGYSNQGYNQGYNNQGYNNHNQNHQHTNQTNSYPAFPRNNTPIHDRNYTNKGLPKIPPRPGFSDRNVSHRTGYIAKPTKSGLIELSKKRKQMRY